MGRGALDESPDHPYALVRSLDGVTAYVSGVLPYADDGVTLVADDPERAVERVITLLAERLREAGFALDDVVRTTVYLTDIGWRSAVNRVYWDRFAPPRPARTTIGVRALPGGAPVEIDAVAQAAASLREG